MEHEVNLHAYETDREAPVVKRFERACERLSLPCTLTETFGGSDNNNFALHGISGIVISCGMYSVIPLWNIRMRKILRRVLHW